MINSIKLFNFQKHSALSLDFTKEINVIYGSSDIGKSSIRRAIEWTLFNKKIDGIRKQGSKQTSVEITFDNGTQIERIRSVSINRYILRHNGEEKTFDAIGKSIPQEIQDAIGINPVEIDEEKIYLNSANQISLPFLLDKSPTSRMKLFNVLTGNELLDKLFVNFNKDILRFGRELKEKKERIVLLEKDIEIKEIEKAKLEKKLERAEKVFITIKNLENQLSNLLKLKELWKNISSSLVECQIKVKLIKVPEVIAIKQLKEKIEKFSQLNQIKTALISTQEIERVKTQLTQTNVKLPYEIPELRCKIDRLAKLQEISLQRELLDAKSVKTEIQLKEETSILKQLQKDRLSLLKEAKFCPTCGQLICQEVK